MLYTSGSRYSACNRTVEPPLLNSHLSTMHGHFLLLSAGWQLWSAGNHFGSILHCIQLPFSLLYYYMRNYCNLIGLEQWYFSLI